MNTFYVFFFGMVAHFIGDFSLQPDFLANMKSKLNYILFCHVMVWTGCISTVLFYFQILTIPKILLLMVGHFIMDYWKSHKEDKTNSLTKDLWIDQSFHTLQILVVTLI